WVPRQSLLYIIPPPKANKLIMGIDQDTLLGIQKFTLRDHVLYWSLVQIFPWAQDWDSVVPILEILEPKLLPTRKQILSLIIPQGINILHSLDPKLPNPDDDGMMIENGEVIPKL
ncbi:DNA-directed RNA polymerase II core subunit rpo21, partial [Marasmius tenuissimus]